MALQSGWKILSINITDGGSEYGNAQTYTLSARTKSKHGQSFAGTCTSNGSGVITSTNITNNGENYSSGSTTLGILNAPGHGAMLIPVIGQNVSMSISDMNQENLSNDFWDLVTNLSISVSQKKQAWSRWWSSESKKTTW